MNFNILRLNLLLFCFFLTISSTFAQWNWGLTAGGQTSSIYGMYSSIGISGLYSFGSSGTGKTLAMDSNGNTYMAIEYDSTDISFGSPANTITKLGERTILVGKLNSSGTLLWYKRIGIAMGHCEIASLTLDTNSSCIYLCGYFQPTSGLSNAYFNSPGTNVVPIDISFETGGPSFASHDNWYGSGDGFIAKYGLDGTFNWAVQITIPYPDVLNQSGSVSLFGAAGDGLGNCYFGGWTQNYDILVNSPSPVTFARKEYDSTWKSANGEFNTYISGPILSGLNISSLALANGNWVASSGQSIYASYDNGVIWNLINSGVINSNVNCLVTNGNTVYAATQGAGLWKSLNAVSVSAPTWSVISDTNLTANTNVSSFAYYSTTHFAVGSPDKGFYWSTNTGTAWTKQNTGLPVTNITTLIFANSGKSILAVIPGYGICKISRTSINAGWNVTGWSQSTGFAPSDLNVSSITPVTGVANNYLAASPGGIYKSTDNGSTWNLWNNSLSNSTSIVIFSSPAPAYRIFVGTTNGVYYSATIDTFKTTSPWTLVGLSGQSINPNSLGANSTSKIMAGTQSNGLSLANFAYGKAIQYASVFFGKMDANGQLVWMKSPKSWSNVGSSTNEIPLAFAADNTGFYVSGSMGSADDPMWFPELSTALSVNCHKAGYLLKYDISGNPVWAHQFGYPTSFRGTTNAGLLAITLDGKGNLYGTGISTSSVIKFDGAPPVNNPNALNYYCLLLAKFSTSDGNCSWVTTDGVGSTLSNGIIGYSIAVNPSTSNIYVGGTFKNSVTFGGITTLTTGAVNMNNPYLAQYRDLGTSSVLSAVIPFTCHSYNGYFGSMDLNGNKLVCSALFMDSSISVGNTNFYKQALGNSTQQNLLFLNWTDGQTLPVELTSFTASHDLHNVTLNWQTATEIENKGFTVERSTNNSKNWESITFVKGAGNSTSVNKYSFIDKNVSTGKLVYRLKQIDYSGQSKYSNEVEINISAPVAFALNQNYPNPFNPSTIISYSLPVESYVHIKVYNILGKEVKSLFNNIKEAGYHQVSFDASDLTSGVYIYSIKAVSSDGKNTFSSSKKLMLLK